MACVGSFLLSRWSYSLALDWLTTSCLQVKRGLSQQITGSSQGQYRNSQQAIKAAHTLAVIHLPSSLRTWNACFQSAGWSQSNWKKRTLQTREDNLQTSNTKTPSWDSYRRLSWLWNNSPNRYTCVQPFTFFHFSFLFFSVLLQRKKV